MSALYTIPLHELRELVDERFSDVMLLEVNGAQYSTEAGRQEAERAKIAWRKANKALRERDVPSVNRLTGEEMER